MKMDGQTMDMPNAAVGHVAEDAVNHRVDPAHFAQPERRCDILRLDVKSGRHGFARLLAITERCVAQKERRHHMHHVCPVASLADNRLVRIGVEEIVLLAERLKYRKMEYTGAEIAIRQMRLLFGVRPVTT